MNLEKIIEKLKKTKEILAGHGITTAELHSILRELKTINEINQNLKILETD